jgi:hypothetical protein
LYFLGVPPLYKIESSEGEGKVGSGDGNHCYSTRNGVIGGSLIEPAGFTAVLSLDDIAVIRERCQQSLLMCHDSITRNMEFSDISPPDEFDDEGLAVDMEDIVLVDDTEINAATCSATAGAGAGAGVGASVGAAGAGNVALSAVAQNTNNLPHQQHDRVHDRGIPKDEVIISTGSLQDNTDQSAMTDTFLVTAPVPDSVISIYEAAGISSAYFAQSMGYKLSDNTYKAFNLPWDNYWSPTTGAQLYCLVLLLFPSDS